MQGYSKGEDSNVDKDTMKSLFKEAVKGHWDKIKNYFVDVEGTHLTKITSSGDTTLHVVIAYGPEHYVYDLLEAIKARHGSSRLKNALSIKNNEENTLLHIAAN